MMLAVLLMLLMALLDNLHLIDAKGGTIYLSSSLIGYITFTSLVLGILKITKKII